MPYQIAVNRIEQAKRTIKNASVEITRLIVDWADAPDNLILVRDSLDEFSKEVNNEADLTIRDLAEAEQWFNYHKDGVHPCYTLGDWQAEVRNGDTIRGYNDWVRSKIGTHRLSFEAYLEGNGNLIDKVDISQTVSLHRVEESDGGEVHYIFDGGGGISVAFADAPDRAFGIGHLSEFVSEESVPVIL